MKLFSHIEYISRDLNLSTDYDIRLDITDMNIEDDFFDVIICNHVLEHIIDDRKAMSELFRVLKLGRGTILQVLILKTVKEVFKDFSITNFEEIEKKLGYLKFD